jgi:uncharacterized protein YoxC
MIGQLLKVAYEIVAVGFIVLVILTVRKARARGKRLFADEPTARIKALSANTSGDHEWDGFQ